MTSNVQRIGAFAAMVLAGLAAFVVSGLASAQESARTGAPQGVILTLDGPVTPASADYLAREIDLASEAGKELIVIEIDTPGGLMDSMKQIIKAILASETPVATYVYPQGARSASAGLYIMYSAHVSAMAPSTNTGAATPIELGAPSKSPEQSPLEESPFEKQDQTSDAPSDQPSADQPAADGDDATRVTEPEPTTGGAAPEPADAAREAPPMSNGNSLRAKMINDAVAYIRALAQERGRNADWAEKAVRDAASIPSREALRLNVVDIIADDLDDLLRQVDGRTVKVASGEKTIHTDGITMERIEPKFYERILALIANPNVAAILLSLGTTGLIIEMWNPGSIFPGALGITCLVLGLYAFQVLPYSWLALALMGIGAILVVIEAYTPTFGVAGLGGIGVFVLGLYFLFPGSFRISPSVLIASAGIGVVFLGAILVAVVGSRSHGPVIGVEALRKREGRVEEWDDVRGEGHVVVEGERWQARSKDPLTAGDRIRVTEVDGLVLVVKAARAAGGLFGKDRPAAV